MEAVDTPHAATGVRLTRRRAETRQRIIDAAYEVFGEVGIREAPVEAISERAGFTRGAFYSNFASKEELFLSLHEAQTTARMVRIESAIDTAIADIDADAGDDVEEAVRIAATRFAQALSEDETWFSLVAELRVLALRDSVLRAGTNAVESRFEETCTRAIDRAIVHLGLTPRADTRSAAVLVISAYESLLTRSLLDQSPRPHTPAEVAELLAKLLTSLLTTQDLDLTGRSGTTDNSAA